MPDTDGDLPNASASSKASLNAPPDSTDTAQTESRPNQAGRGRFVPLSTLWWNLLCAAIIAPLAFVMFALALLWDQWLPLALVALPLGIAAAVWAVWCLMMLQRFYLDQRDQRPSEVTQLPGV